MGSCASILACSLLLASTALVGCTSVSATGTARETFSTQYSCPADRVNVTDVGPESRPAPSPDVAADPARLTTWKDAQSQTPAGEIYRVEGCGHLQMLSCRHGTGSNHDTGTLQYTCARVW